MATRRRLDGRPGKLATWSLVSHLKSCRCIFSAAVDWGWLDRNPFVPLQRRGKTPLRVKARPRSSDRRRSFWRRNDSGSLSAGV